MHEGALINLGFYDLSDQTISQSNLTPLQHVLPPLTLDLGGLFVLNFGSDYEDMFAAESMRIAVEEINRLQSIPGIFLKENIIDTSVVRTMANQSLATFSQIQVNTFATLLSPLLHPHCDDLTKVKASGVIGPGFSTEVIAAAPTLGAARTVSIGFSSTSPALSNKERFPYFARVCPSDDLQGMAMADL
eukprot:666213-Hanusia_phi.AAC.1